MVDDEKVIDVQSEEISGEEKKSLGRELVWYISIALVGFFILGLFAGLYFGTTSYAKETNLSSDDRNFILSMAYQSGECERNDKITAYLPHLATDGNALYSVPVCIDKQLKDNNTKN